MKNTTRWIGVLAAALLLVSAAGAAAETGETAQVLEPADTEPVASTPVQDCGAAAELPGLDLQSSATPASGGGTVYLCTSAGFCNGGDGCPPQQRCARVACGFPGPLTCTTQTLCVTDCQAGVCASIGSCG